MKLLSALLIAALLPGTGVFAAGLTIQPNNSGIVVEPGSVELAGRTVTVKEKTSLLVAPAPVLEVKDEQLRLSADKPAGYAKGTRLRACNARDVNASGSFVPGSLVVKKKDKSGEVLKEGEDYLLDPEWGHLGIGPKSKVTTNDVVKASYQVSHRRIDAVQVAADGKVTLKPGRPHISAPVPPEPDAGCTVVAHVLADYRATKVTPEAIYPVLESAEQAVTATTTGRIPKTLAKLKDGKPVTIVCLGDSVTAGGNASKPEYRYVDVFAAGLKSRFPKAAINVQNISAGGSASRHWLHPEQFPYRGMKGPDNPAQFKRVLEAKPDLVTIEFVNDAGLNAAQVEEAYGDILKRLEPLGTEVVLITPHFTMWKMMGFKSMGEKEKRPYVLALREFATKHKLGLADAAARWEHLVKEGLPYLTLLDNTINHPDDRGHRLFAEELWKCFQ